MRTEVVTITFTCDRCGKEENAEARDELRINGWAAVWPPEVVGPDDPYGPSRRSADVCPSCLTEDERAQFAEWTDEHKRREAERREREQLGTHDPF
jgi:hypothetical protein